MMGTKKNPVTIKGGVPIKTAVETIAVVKTDPKMPKEDAVTGPAIVGLAGIVDQRDDRARPQGNNRIPTEETTLDVGGKNREQKAGSLSPNHEAFAFSSPDSTANRGFKYLSLLLAVPFEIYYHLENE